MAEELEDSQLGDPALLRTQAAYFRAIFDMPVGLLLVDAQGHIVLANEAQAQLWGYTRDELRGAPLQRFILPDDHFVDGDLLQDLLALRRSSYTVDKRCLRKDGMVWWGRFTVSLARDLNGQPFHTLLVCEDITDRERQEQVDRDERQLDQFVSRLSHDLRAPLANVKLYVGLLKKGPPEKRDEYLQVLSQQAVRLEKILDDLTEMSHLDLGKTEFHFVMSDLNEVVSELQDKWVATALARHLSLSFELTPDLPPIMADSSLLQQATTHLLRNACDYSAPESHITCHTGLCQQEARSWVTLSITNSGLGLTSEELQHVGERFYRGGAARHYKIDGTGLGLALCREIVTRHGGRLMANSEPGMTTTFSIWLEPAANSRLEANAPVDQ